MQKMKIHKKKWNLKINNGASANLGAFYSDAVIKRKLPSPIA